MKLFYHNNLAQGLTAIPLPPILRMWTGDPLRKNVGLAQVGRAIAADSKRYTWVKQLREVQAD